MPLIYAGGQWRNVPTTAQAQASGNPAIVQNNASGSSPAAVAAMVSNSSPVVTDNKYTQPAPQPAAQPQPQPQPSVDQAAVERAAAAAAAAAAKAAAEAAAAAAEERRVNEALAAAKTFFETYGMNDLWGGVEKLVRSGYSDANTISGILSRDAEYMTAYYKRFPAVQQIRELNKQRTAQGLAPIAEPSPGTYVSLEQSYRQALAGLPSGVYDTSTNVAKWITGEVSATELQDRVTVALNYINYAANGDIKKELRDIYKMTDAEMAAYVIAPEQTLDYTKKEYQRRLGQATIGGAAESVGVNLSDSQRDLIAGNEAYASSFANSQAQFGKIAQEQDAWVRLAQMSGQTLTTEELVSDQFGLQGAADIAEKKRKLASQERARFGGSSGIGKTSLSAKKIGSQG